jgi:two-component system, response regulator YesN
VFLLEGAAFMYNILVVDDESIERKGIVFLINENQYPFIINEAENGIEAFEYIVNNDIDILFTDIKMPGIDGLDLAHRVREIKPDVKIIIYSAYGEFDFAKRAIGLNVMNYILKPINIDEFKNVMQKVIKLCDEDRKRKNEKNTLYDAYKKAIIYEKEKLLFSLLNSNTFEEELEEKFRFTDLDYSNHIIQMVLIDLNSKFFDVKEADIEHDLSLLLDRDFDYLNLNDRQSIIFIKSKKQVITKEELFDIGKRLISCIKDQYNINVSVVFGKSLDSIEKIHLEYELMEEIVEYKFFLDEGAILFTDNEYIAGSFSSESIDKILKNIYQHIEIHDFHSVYISIDLLFNCIKIIEGLSASFVKYIFTGIVTELYKKVNETDSKKIRLAIEEILKCNNLPQLKEIIDTTVKKIIVVNDAINQESGKGTIDKVLSIIGDEYQNDISLEYLAAKVFLTPTYLSYLFKREVKESLIKYVNRYRLERAKALLGDTNIKIIDISNRVGFASQSYFCTIFKNYYGITPAQYRGKVN